MALKTHALRHGDHTSTMCGRRASEANTGPDPDCKVCVRLLEDAEQAVRQEPFLSTTTATKLEIRNMTCDGCDKPRVVKATPDGRGLLCRRCMQRFRVTSRKRKGRRLWTSPLSSTEPRRKQRRPRGQSETRKYRRQYTKNPKFRDQPNNIWHKASGR